MLFPRLDPNWDHFILPSERGAWKEAEEEGSRAGGGDHYHDAAAFASCSHSGDGLAEVLTGGKWPKRGFGRPPQHRLRPVYVHKTLPVVTTALHIAPTSGSTCGGFLCDEMGASSLSFRAEPSFCCAVFVQCCAVRCAVLSCAVLSCAVLCCAVVWCAVVCCAVVLCCALLCLGLGLAWCASQRGRERPAEIARSSGRELVACRDYDE
jgi:hypothetical protein